MYQWKNGKMNKEKEIIKIIVKLLAGKRPETKRMFNFTCFNLNFLYFANYLAFLFVGVLKTPK